ncbi:MAG: universal stress protein [Acidobacteria bacterium]|nr:universal stress protein [Acidobacteriota bacterium]
MHFDSVVVGVDFSDASLIAVETALELDSGGATTVYLVHVLEDTPLVLDLAGVTPSLEQELGPEALERLKTLVPAKLREGLTVKTEVVSGSPPHALAEYAKRVEADLIVVGTHGRKGLTRVLLGSTAEALLREAPCKVLVSKHKVG